MPGFLHNNQPTEVPESRGEAAATNGRRRAAEGGGANLRTTASLRTVDGAMCTLGLTKKSSNEDDMVEIVAFAEVYRPNPEGKIHNIPMDNHMRVNITIVKDGFDEWALPVTNDVADQFILSDGVGTFVQWPRDLIFLKGEEPPSFDKRSTTKGNKNAFVLKASPLEKETLARFPLSNKKILNLLKEDVLELHEMFELLEPQHCQFSISLSEETFHYTSNDLETIINREDLSQFLSCDSLNVSILQGFLFHHWTLIFICPHVRKGYIFDPASTTSTEIIKELTLSFKVASSVDGNGRGITFSKVKCRKQPGSLECGYYVMRYMYGIINFHRGSRDIGLDWIANEDSYSTLEFDEIRNVWARFFIDVLANM